MKKNSKKSNKTFNAKNTDIKKHRQWILPVLAALPVLCVAFLLYGLYSGIRVFLITMAMHTGKHQYIARILYSRKGNRGGHGSEQGAYSG